METILEDNLQSLWMGHEVPDVALFEPHPLGELEFHPERLGLLNRNHSELADLVDGLGDYLTDLHVVVGCDGGHLGDLVLGLQVFGQAVQV